MQIVKESVFYATEKELIKVDIISVSSTSVLILTLVNLSA